MLNVGVLRYNSGDLAGAAACWREAAQRGKGNACRYYARCLTRGEGVREDRAAATRWLKKGASAGDASSAYSLYLAGESTRTNTSPWPPRRATRPRAWTWRRRRRPRARR